MILRKGTKGPEVKRLQEKLLSLGYNLGKYGADGDFGQNTYDAVVDFQRRNGLDDDGEVGPATWSALERATSSGGSDPILRMESKGEKVKELQRLLMSKDYYVGPYKDDGDFGQGTYDAVVDFQRRNGLDDDGEVGPATWAALRSSTSIKGSNNELMIGAKGERVRELQRKLIALGYSCGTYGADGDFGGSTKAAVEKFQDDYAIKIILIPGDFKKGVAGKSTLEILNKEYDNLPKWGGHQLNDIEKSEAGVALGSILGISAKFEEKYLIASTYNTEIWYKLSKKATVGGGNFKLNVSNGKLSGASVSTKAFSNVFSLSSNLLDKKFGVSMSRELMKFGDGTLSIDLHDFKMTPMPQVTFTIQYEHNGVKIDGGKYTAYQILDIIIKDPSFWRNLEAAAAVGVIIGLVFLVAAVPESVIPALAPVVEKVLKAA